VDTYLVWIHIGYSTKTYPWSIWSICKKIKQNNLDTGAIRTGLLKAQNWIRIGPWSGQRPSPIHSPVTYIPPLLLPSGLCDLAARHMHENAREVPDPTVRNHQRRPTAANGGEPATQKGLLFPYPTRHPILISHPHFPTFLSSHHLVLLILSRCQVVL
jgi:hypothetical protein